MIVVGDPEPHGLDEYDGGGEPLDLDAVCVDPTIPTNVYYTSGTTGRPKGCQLGHSYWLRFVELWLSLYGMEPDDRLLCCVPFFYGDAPWELLTSLHAGCPWIVMRRFSVSRFWHVVRDNRVTQLFTLASMPALLLKAPSTSEDREQEVRFAVHVGVPANLHAQMHARWGFPWAEGYGLTETGLVIAMPLARAEAMVGSGSIGMPCPGAEVRLLDEQGEEVATGMPGEIAVRAPGMMQAYLNRPHDTAETLREGWLHTGDLARVDDLGYYHFLGRRKDIVRRSGENVSAGEVEAVLREHPQVRDAAVIAIPDDLRGEEVGAYIEPVDPRGDLRPEELVNLCLARLARHKVPRYVRICRSPLPRTASMRVNKPVLRENDAAAPAARWDREQALGW
jgi:crotonobetaine/carnitine-CoA ligase